MKQIDAAFDSVFSWIASIDSHVIGALQIAVFFLLLIFLLFDILKN